jgi:glycyl-tRNA synthetase beta chain
MPQLLLEILSEEIPARMQGGAARDLERLFRDRMGEAGLPFGSVQTYAGPRRLTLVAEGLPAAQGDQVEELKGPKVSAPPQALEGFLRKAGLTRDQLTERDGVLFARVERRGRPTPEIVAEAALRIVREFPWPKSMRWGTGTLRWVRPIRRILCLFDGRVVPFAIDGIESGDLTEGHRFHGSGAPVRVADFADYKARLADERVVLDAEERKRMILESARALCAEQGLELVEDEGLLDEVAGLAEFPRPILGRMDETFLTLPPEVIRTSMRTHQKYFAVRERSERSADLQVRSSSEGASLEARAPGTPETRQTATNGDKAGDAGQAARPLAPWFVTVANVEASDGGKAIQEGNARVLSARLNDARFFWDEDLKTGFGPWLEKLKGVTFHAKLGTLAERVDRIAALAREIAPLVGADPDLAEQAARLAKADLASGMVGEFPELQGIMGGYYARELLGRPQSKFGYVPALPETDGQEDPLAGVERFETEAERTGAQSTASQIPLVPAQAGTQTEATGRSPALDRESGAAVSDPSVPGSGSPPARGRAKGEGLTQEQVSQIADAVRDHYRPQGPNDAVPTAPLTVAVALADKLDTLVGFFAIDEKPTGSKDPYALRRAALGVIRLLQAGSVRLGIRAAVQMQGPMWLAQGRDLENSPVAEAAAAFWDAIEQRKADAFAAGEQSPYARPVPLKESEEWRAFDRFLGQLETSLLAFFADRLKVLLRDEGRRHDLVDAVFALGDDDLVRVVARVEALSGFLATDDGANLLAGYKRATNILKAEAKKNAAEEPLYGEAVDADLLAEPEERALHDALLQTLPEVERKLGLEDFTGAMGSLAALRAPVDAFFDRVLVNAPEAPVRLNRLRLLSAFRSAADRVADFSQVSG